MYFKIFVYVFRDFYMEKQPVFVVASKFMKYKYIFIAHTLKVRRFHNYCATCFHYIATLKMALFRYLKKTTCKENTTSAVDDPDLHGALLIIQPKLSLWLI